MFKLERNEFPVSPSKKIVLRFATLKERTPKSEGERQDCADSTR